MSAAARLLKHREEIRVELQRIRCAWVPDLIEHLEQSLEASRRAADALTRANAQRQDLVRAAIHRAAERYLTAAFRAITPRRAWAGALWRYLERRHAQYGLQQRPCKRSIREALKNWTPPSGGALSSAYGALDNQGGNDGREDDE